MMYPDPWVLPSSQSRHTGETFDRLARQQDGLRRSTNALVYFRRVVEAERLIEESSGYTFAGWPP